MVLGAWTLLDPAYTLQPGMRAGQWSWSDATLQCNVTKYLPNDLNYHGWHFGNSLRMMGKEVKSTLSGT